MKKTKHLAILAILTLTFVSAPLRTGAVLIGNASGATLNITPADASYDVNDNFTVSISVNTRGQKVVTVAAYLFYDNTSFLATSIDTTGTVFNTALFESLIDQNAGTIRITVGKQSPGVNSNNALVAKVYFTAIGPAAPVADNIVFDFSAGGTADSNVIRDDGLGTDILSGVYNARYSVAAADMTPPTLTQVTAVPSSKNTRPSYTFNSTEAGTISYAGDCSSATANATAGSNKITFNALSDGVHDNCTITVTDANNNRSQPLTVSPFTIDTVAPILAEITPVPDTNNSGIVTYAFSSTEAGVISYGGNCRSTSMTNAVTGENIITFDLLPDRDHTNCTIKVTDAAGNQSLPLAVNPFLVDTKAPILSQVTPVPPATGNTRPGYTFRSSEAGTISYAGDCTSLTVNALSGNNTVFFDTLPDGIHDNCVIYVTDTVGHRSEPLLVNAFAIDTAAPVLAEVSPVPPLTNVNKPVYVFNSAEAGKITYAGDCSSPTTQAIAGDNRIVMNPLSDGIHGNCTITVTDAAGNRSAPLSVSPFTTSTGALSLSNISVSRTINTAIITWNTDRNTSSRVEYGPTASYGSNTAEDPNLVTAHSVELFGLTGNTVYHFRVRSRDAAGNEIVSGDQIFRTGSVADLNADGFVNIIDVGIMMSYWNSSEPAADLNQDGTVNSIDAGILLSDWSV